MTFADPSAIQQSHKSSRVGRAMSNLAEYIQHRRLVTRTISELSSLSDRELSDIGLHRSMIRSVAMSNVYPK